MTTETHKTDDIFFPRQGVSRLKKVCMMTGLSKTTIYQWIKVGKFPKPVKLSPTMTAWRNSDVLDWISKLGQEVE